MEAGAQVNSRTVSGNTPLHWAAECNKDSGAAAAAAAALLAAGANRHARNDDGDTPLDVALAREDAGDCTKLVEILLRAAADSDGEHGSSGGGSSSGGSSTVGSSSGGGEAASNGGSSEAASSSQVTAALSQLHLGEQQPQPAQQAMPECRVCWEPSACLTGPCGHLVCERCAEHGQVRQQQCSSTFFNGGMLCILDQGRCIV